jgi:hypothetical protein
VWAPQLGHFKYLGGFGAQPEHLQLGFKLAPGSQAGARAVTQSWLVGVVLKHLQLLSLLHVRG